MRMNQNEKRFDFHGLGLALKKAREEKGWTQAYDKVYTYAVLVEIFTQNKSFGFPLRIAVRCSIFNPSMSHRKLW